MTKAELISQLAEHTGLSKKDTERVLAGLTTITVLGLKEDGKVLIPGIGYLKTSKREARQARNPKTGEVVNVPAKTVVKFTASKEFKEFF